MAAEVSLSRATESTFASIASATGLPSDSGLTFVGFEHDEVSYTLDEVVVEKADGTRRSTAQGGRTIGVGGGVAIRRGSITITRELDLPSSNVTDETYDVAANVPSAAFLATLLNDDGAPAAQADAIATAGTAKTWTPTTAANVPNGSLVGIVSTGKAHSARVTGRSGGDLLVNPAFPFTPTVSTDVRLMRQFYAAQAWASATEVIRYDGRGDTSGTSKGQRLTFFGCKLESIEYRGDDIGRVVESMTLRAAYVEVDNASTDLDGAACVCASGMVTATAFDGGSRIAADYCGRGGTLATPANADAISAWDTGLWTFKLSVALEIIPGTLSNNIGARGWRVGSADVEITFPMCATTVSLDSDRENSAKRYMVIDAGTGGEGLGFSIHVNGLLKSDPVVFERGESEHVQKLVFQSADYCNDTTDAPALDGVNSWLTIGWWL